nr:MAG TPA: hypothetical protein [Caudoviricetes sp.]
MFFDYMTVDGEQSPGRPVTVALFYCISGNYHYLCH